MKELQNLMEGVLLHHILHELAEQFRINPLQFGEQRGGLGAEKVAWGAPLTVATTVRAP